MADGAEQRRGVEKAGLVPVEPSGWTRRSVVDEEENGAVTEQWVVQGAGQASQLARSEPADDVVAPALDPGAVQADHRMPLSDQLHERIAAGVGQLGKVAGQEILEDQLEGPPPNVGVAIVVARDDHQEPGGDERLKEGTRVAQLRLVTQGGEVAGQQDAIGSQARLGSNAGNGTDSGRRRMLRACHGVDVLPVRRYVPSMNLTQLLPPSNEFSRRNSYRSSPWKR